MRRQAEHRIRKAAGLARPGWNWAAAIAMNAPSVLAAAVAGWFVYASDEPAVEAMAGILFAMALVWAVLVTAESWRVLRRFTRRETLRDARDR